MALVTQTHSFVHSSTTHSVVRKPGLIMLPSQTFSVSGRPWRGGLVQAILHAVPEGRSPEDTFIWCDIFGVNQHLRSPYGGLLAFTFEPLRNAMLEVS